MTRFDRAGYPPAILELCRLMPLASLGPGTPDHSVKAKLDALDNTAFGGKIIDRDMADACRAGLWLAFNFVDEAHTRAQDLNTVEGSYWHALMHRREPDHSNAAYWFHRVGTHAIFPALRDAAAELALSAPPQGAFLARQEQWDPFAFNDLCQASQEATAPCHDLCRRIQRVEWELLFDHCYLRAVGMAG
jgi:hypothetical protein